jgi:hypothetical protein
MEANNHREEKQKVWEGEMEKETESIQRVLGSKELFQERSSERDAFRVQECTRWHWLLMMYEGRSGVTAAQFSRL